MANWVIRHISDDEGNTIVIRCAPYWNIGHIHTHTEKHSFSYIKDKIGYWADENDRFDWDTDEIRTRGYGLTKRFTIYDIYTDQFKKPCNCNDTVFAVLRGILTFDKPNKPEPEPEPVHVSGWDTGKDATAYSGWKT